MVTPDSSRKILSVDIFYTQQGIAGGKKDDRNNTINRFWHHAESKKNGRSWSANISLFSTDKPLWVYANVLYPLDKSVAGAGYYYGLYSIKQFNLSSLMQIATSQQLKAAGVKALNKPSLVIESFKKGWEKQWFTYKPEAMGRKTHKLHDPQWAAPEGAKLALDLRSEVANKLVIGIDGYAAVANIASGSAWQTIILSAADFKDASEKPMQDWKGIKELRFTDAEHLRGKKGTKPRLIGARWKGKDPEFRNLRWVK